jgi:hypothetical protein
MDLVTVQSLATEVITLLKAGQSIRWRSCGNLLSQHGLEPFNDEILDRGPAARGSNLCALQEAIGQIYRGFHEAINK